LSTGPRGMGAASDYKAHGCRVRVAKNMRGDWGVRESVGWLGFAYAEDRCSAVWAHAFDGRFAVLERDVLWVLDLNVRLAFYAICLWHFEFN
jgi:hypothetical protein